MILCLTKHIRNNQAFTMVELTMAVAFSVLLMTGVYGFYNMANQSYSSGIAGQNLQDGADLVISKILEGQSESGVVYRLSTAVSYMIPNGSANELYTCGGASQVAACDTSDTTGEIYYCQDSPCTSSDSTARWYYLNSTGTSIIYHHPVVGGTVEQTIYTVPKGSTLTLRFSPAQVGSPAAASTKVVEIDVALRQNLSATTQVTNTRSNLVNGSGSASTFVLLRDHT